MPSWTINGVDISEKYGVYLAKGAYNALKNYATAKTYLTEEIREINGEKVHITMPRLSARSVSISFFMAADTNAEFWDRHDQFLSFLMSAGLFDLHLVRHNRTYRLYFYGGEKVERMDRLSDGRSLHTVTITFREPDPDCVLQDIYLTTEDGVQITAEGWVTPTAEQRYFTASDKIIK